MGYPRYRKRIHGHECDKPASYINERAEALEMRHAHGDYVPRYKARHPILKAPLLRLRARQHRCRPPVGVGEKSRHGKRNRVSDPRYHRDILDLLPGGVIRRAVALYVSVHSSEVSAVSITR